MARPPSAGRSASTTAPALVRHAAAAAAPSSAGSHTGGGQHCQGRPGWYCRCAAQAPVTPSGTIKAVCDITSAPLTYRTRTRQRGPGAKARLANRRAYDVMVMRGSVEQHALVARQREVLPLAVRAGACGLCMRSRGHTTQCAPWAPRCASTASREHRRQPVCGQHVEQQRYWLWIEPVNCSSNETWRAPAQTRRPPTLHWPPTLCINVNCMVMHAVICSFGRKLSSSEQLQLQSPNRLSGVQCLDG